MPDVSDPDMVIWQTALFGLPGSHARELLALIKPTGVRVDHLTALSVEDAGAVVAAWTGFGVGGIYTTLFMAHWKRKYSTTAAAQLPIMPAHIVDEVNASHMRGDTRVQLSSAVAKAVDTGFAKCRTLEPVSDLMVALWTYPVGSGLVGKVALEGGKVDQSGHEEDGKGGVRRVGLEYEKEKHIVSRMAWLEYSAEVRASSEEYERWGIPFAIMEFNFLLERYDWNLCRAYIILYFKKYKGKMPIARDPIVWQTAWEGWDEAGRPILEPSRVGSARKDLYLPATKVAPGGSGADPAAVAAAGAKQAAAQPAQETQAGSSAWDYLREMVGLVGELKGLTGALTKAQPAALPAAAKPMPTATALSVMRAREAAQAAELALEAKKAVAPVLPLSSTTAKKAVAELEAKKEAAAKEARAQEDKDRRVAAAAKATAEAAKAAKEKALAAKASAAASAAKKAKSKGSNTPSAPKLPAAPAAAAKPSVTPEAAKQLAAAAKILPPLPEVK